ncbi:MAG: hypothetical protein ABI323_14910 [Solirubrobacteraceae bacterium]
MEALADFQVDVDLRTCGSNKLAPQAALPRRYERRYHSNPLLNVWNTRGNKGSPGFIRDRTACRAIAMQKVEGLLSLQSL